MKDCAPCADAKSGGGVTRINMARARKGARTQGWRDRGGSVKSMMLPEDDGERLESSEVKHVTIRNRIASQIQIGKFSHQRANCDFTFDARQVGAETVVDTAAEC